MFPITYRRGSGAHLDVGGARGAAIRRGLSDQLGLVVEEVEPFGLAGSAGSIPLRITVTVFGPALHSRAGLCAGRGQFSVQEISEGFAAARGLALPSQLRRMLRAQGRDLHAEFIRLLPSPPQPVSIQRWTMRRVGLMAGTAFLAFVLASMFLSAGRWRW